MHAPDGTTYMAGCTDEKFTSPHCPTQKKPDQQLLNIVQCADTESDGTVLWSSCPGPSTRTEIGAPDACTCTDTENGLFSATTSFPAIAILPTSIGETISFYSGHTPSTKGVATVTSTATNGQLTTMTMPIATSTSTSSPTPSASTLSKGAKAGIGVGAAVGGTLLLVLAASLIISYRRKHSKFPAYQPTAPPGPEAFQSPPPQYATPYYNPLVSPMAAADTSAGYPGYAAYKSELPAVSIQLGSNTAFSSELPANEVDVTRNGTPSLISVASSPAPTGHASMVSDISRAPSAPPSVQYSPSDASGLGPYGRGPNGGNMPPIAELHG